jgi:hypothetical protein
LGDTRPALSETPVYRGADRIYANIHLVAHGAQLVGRIAKVVMEVFEASGPVLAEGIFGAETGNPAV